MCSSAHCGWCVADGGDARQLFDYLLLLLLLLLLLCFCCSLSLQTQFTDIPVSDGHRVEAMSSVQSKVMEHKILFAALQTQAPGHTCACTMNKAKACKKMSCLG